MSTRNLETFFSPRSIALIGASRHARTVGNVVAENLLSGGFGGPILPVNPHEAAICGVMAYEDVADLPAIPDLAIIATPAATIPDIITSLGTRGCRASVILTAGFEADTSERQREAIRVAAHDNDVRVIGPNCLGIMAPHGGVNATFAHIAPISGRIACVMQSGALAAAVLDWATARGIGFSKLVSLGDAIDVDFGDMLHYLALDPETDGIILYIEGLTHARKFMTAARAASRIKPIVAIKAGRNEAAAQAVKSHTGALAGSDRVYEAAFRRAGVVRVGTLEDVFDAIEILARHRPLCGPRLAIITNGGGMGVLAADALLAQNGVLATLAPATIATLDGLLPASWSKANPVDLIGDADAARYTAALPVVMADPGVDAVLVMNCPTALASSADSASSVIDCLTRQTVSSKDKPVLTCWLGSQTSVGARARFSGAGIPTFPTPEQAIKGFGYLNDFQVRASHLLEVGEGASAIDRVSGDAMLRGALQSGREWLDEGDSKALLRAYGIPIVQTLKAANPDEVAEAARAIGGTVVVKIRSQDITHKAEIGGVALDLATPDDARAAAQAMESHIRALLPRARLEGFTVDEMIRRPGSTELIAGIASDATFGPVILFGRGGTSVAESDDTAVALPPLTRVLAADLIDRTRVSRQLRARGNRSAAKLSDIEDILIVLARIATDHPEIVELDINPLLVDETGVIALDARVRLRDPSLAIPAVLVTYPHDLERVIVANDGGEVLLRPIRPEDAPALQRFIESLDPTWIRARFFETMKRLPPAMLARLTQIDYDREMALVAIDRGKTPVDGDPGEDIICGVGRILILPGGAEGEYALTACPATVERGIAHALMTDLTAYARSRGLRELHGDELSDSTGLINLARDFQGIVSHTKEDPTIAGIVLPLRPIEQAA
jgi:acetyltransferase